MEAEFRFRPADTTPEAWELQFEVLRRLSFEDKARIWADLCDEQETLLRDGIRLRHPDYDGRQLQQAYLRLVLGDEVFRRHFPGIEIET